MIIKNIGSTSHKTINISLSAVVNGEPKNRLLQVEPHQIPSAIKTMRVGEGEYEIPDHTLTRSLAIPDLSPLFEETIKHDLYESFFYFLRNR
jgi:hypothetical protein